MQEENAKEALESEAASEEGGGSEEEAEEDDEAEVSGFVGSDLIRCDDLFKNVFCIHLLIMWSAYFFSSC